MRTQIWLTPAVTSARHGKAPLARGFSRSRFSVHSDGAAQCENMRQPADDQPPAWSLEARRGAVRLAHPTRFGMMAAALYDRWVAETLMPIRGQSRERACTMPVRTAIMLEIAVDRRGWPEGILAM